MVDLIQRKNRAMESLLEDEALTAGLDDTAANELINWGTDCISRVFQQLDGLSESEIEKKIADKLSAIRRLMRFISRWAVNRTGMELTNLLEWSSQVLQALKEVYIDSVSLPSPEACLELITMHINSNPKDMVVALRTLVEGDSAVTSINEKKSKNIFDFLFGGKNG